jgi:hypothetical protein
MHLAHGGLGWPTPSGQKPAHTPWSQYPQAHKSVFLKSPSCLPSHTKLMSQVPFWHALNASEHDMHPS